MAVWKVELVPEFEVELRDLSAEVRIEILAQARVLERFGPAARRPKVDTLKGSKHANMKELRFDVAEGVWRVAFAFDPARRRCSWWPATKVAKAKSCFIDASLQPRISGWMRT